MNKRLFRRVRVVGDVIMAVDIAFHAYRLVKEIYTNCKKKKTGEADKEENAAPQTTVGTGMNEQG